MARDTIKIDGVTYDITNFKHPGGNIINYAKNSTDATDVFHEFHHRSTKAGKVLRSLPVYHDGDEHDESLERSHLLTERQQEMTTDFREMRANLVTQGCFEPDYIHVYFRMLELVFYFGLGTWFASYNIYASILSFIAFKTRCGWVQHECGHLSFTGIRVIDRAIQTFTMGFGGGVSSSVWNSMHQKHHATPQKIKHDIDLDTTPFVAFFDRAFEDNTNGKVSARFMNRWWMRVQAWTFLPVVNGIFVHLFWMYYLHPKKVFHRLCSAKTREVYIETTFEAVSMASSHIALPIIFYNGGSSGGGLLWCYFLLMIVNFWNFIYLFGHFSLSHTFTGVIPDNKHLLWFEYALNHTVNISTKSQMVSWVMGYLNFQIEHHLFPSMPQYKNAIAAPYIRAFCDRWAPELKYTEHSYKDAWCLMLSNLNQVGKHYYDNGVSGIGVGGVGGVEYKQSDIRPSSPVSPTSPVVLSTDHEHLD
jgi:fatty acid desaturase 2 (delta-6 desaturase)